MGNAQAKTGVEGTEQSEMVRNMVLEYVRGLCWVMRYYYDGSLPASYLYQHLATGSTCLHSTLVHWHKPQCSGCMKTTK